MTFWAPDGPNPHHRGRGVTRLRVASQHLHVKQRDIAQEVTHTGDLPVLPALNKVRESAANAVRHLRATLAWPARRSRTLTA
jgi:hypothetical protein